MSARFICGGATLCEVPLDAVVSDPIPAGPIQLTSTQVHGLARDYWDRDEWGRFIPGSCIRQY